MILPVAIRLAIAHHVDSTWYLRGGTYHVRTSAGRVTHRGDCICPPRWMRDFSRTRTTTWGVVPNEHAHLFDTRPDADHASAAVPVEDWTMVERYGYHPDGGRIPAEQAVIRSIREMHAEGHSLTRITEELTAAGHRYRDGGHSRVWTTGRVRAMLTAPTWEVAS